MEWPEITANTPVEEVVRIHKMIWDYVIEHEEKPDTPYLNNCAFCEYGHQVAKDKGDFYHKYDWYSKTVTNMCKYCPGDWSHEDIPAGSDFACERNYGLFYRWNNTRLKTDGQDLSAKLAKQIRDIPIRTEILKGE